MFSIPPLLALEPLTLVLGHAGPRQWGTEPQKCKKMAFSGCARACRARVVGCTCGLKHSMHPLGPHGAHGHPPPISACHLWARRIYFKISQTQNLMQQSSLAPNSMSCDLI